MGGRLAVCTAVLAMAAGLIYAPAAAASFHLIKVREVFPGTSARPGSGYVELQMYAAGQNLVQLGNLKVYNSTGTVTDTFTPGNSVAGFANQSTVLIADSEYAAQFPSGPAADFTDPNLNLSPAGGAVCWPQTEPPFDDCASWGNFSGQAMLASPDTAPAAPTGIPNGQAIRRSIAGGSCATLLEEGDDSDNSSVDFAVVSPAPRNNATPPSESACITPTTTIDSRPANPTKATAAAFTYHSTPAGASFECKLDAAAFASCEATGIGYPGPLGAGSHNFQVRATNLNGTGPAASYTWTIDLTPPTTTIGAPLPANPGPGKSTTFFFSASENGSSFQCSLAPLGGIDSFAPCSSGQTYTNLNNGEYVFKVFATDPAGNVGPPAQFTWRVDNSLLDTTPPETSIESHPPDPSGSSTAAFTYTSNEAGSSFECALDAAPFAACPATGIVYSGLLSGPHAFQVRAIDPSGNVDLTPAGYSFSVVVDPSPFLSPAPGSVPASPATPARPQTVLSSKPAARTRDRTPTFRFRADAAAASFQCAVDGQPFKPCRSPFTTRSLSFGRHTFSVRALVGAAADATPAKLVFKVVRAGASR
jgi:hypothetical protein